MSFPGEHASLSARSGNDPAAASLAAHSGNDPATHEETYGPIRLRRYVKEDGRTLILYARGELAQDGPAQGRPALGVSTQDGPLPTQDRSSLE